MNAPADLGQRARLPLRVSLEPRSIFGATAAAILLVSVPLVVLALTAALYARQIADQSTRLLDGGIRVVQQAQVLEDHLVGMERALRQYEVVGEPELADLFRQRHEALRRALDELMLAPQPQANLVNLAQLRSEADEVASALEGPGTTNFATLATRFERMRRLAGGVSDDARGFIDGEAQSIQGTALRSQRTLLIYCAMLVPLVALVAMVLAVYVGRPLRQIDRAIRAIGAGRLDQPVPAVGPLELRRLSRQLNWLRERLRTIEEDKNRFLRAMAHELKTPLASVREGADLLSDGALGRLSPQQQEVADILRNNSVELQTLIENLLAYEEWRNRAGRLELAVVPLRGLVEHCVQRYRLVAAARRLSMEVDCDDVAIHVDRSLLRMSLDNLVSNAVKFSPSGGTVTVCARVKAGTGAPMERQLIIEVADEGPGIPQGERTRIYEAFYQGAPPPGAHVQGTGIGLAVVRDFVQAHRGAVELVDGEYRGAHFRLSIPVRVEPGHELAA